MTTSRLLCSLGVLSLPVVAMSAPAVGAPAEVRVVRPERGDIVRWVTLPGGIRPWQQVTLYAKVGGYLASVAADRGDRVKAGQVLAEIDVPELRADLGKLKAEAAIAAAALRRVREAREKATDLVTPQAVDEAEGRDAVAKATLQRAEIMLSCSRVTAPFDGIVTARMADPGAYVPAATSGSVSPTAAIVTVVDFGKVRAQVAVPEVESSLVTTGQPVRISVDGVPGRTFEATVSRLGHVLDDVTRTMQVEADVPNADGVLRPGMFASMRLGVDRHLQALLLPVEALVVEKAGTFAFVAEAGKAKKTAVTIGFNDGVHGEVLTGLSGSESVILCGKTPPADGAAVAPVEAR